MDDEYIEIKKDCKEQIEKLEIQLSILPEQSKVDIPKLIDQAIESLTNLWKTYSEGGMRSNGKLSVRYSPKNWNLTEIIIEPPELTPL